MQGYKLTEHPDVIGSNRNPDYLVEANGEKVYVECKQFKNLTDEEKKLEKVMKDILYQLSTLRSKHLFYKIEEFTVIEENVSDLNGTYDEIQSILNEVTKENIIDEYEYVHKKYELIRACCLSQATTNLFINL
ncbi:MAG: hypothetical protein M3Q56_12860 [Bacteroidota bacterium]|nr:hypothetical protein [Bacteroidota bacterium]